MKVDLELRHRKVILDALRKCKHQGLDRDITDYLEELLQPKGIAMDANEGDEVIYNGERYAVALRFKVKVEEGPDDDLLLVPWDSFGLYEDMPKMHDLPLIPVTKLSWPEHVD